MSARVGAIRILVFCLALLCFVSFVVYARRVHWYYSTAAAGDVAPVTSSSATPQPQAEATRLACPGNVSSAAVREPGGFVVTLRFWEQQTQAVKSLVQLQCLATRMGMRVVEPFLYGSFFGFPLGALAGESMRLSDLIDVDVWNRETTSKFGLFPLAEWSEFLRDSPRDLILVCIKYRNPPRIRLPSPGFRYTGGCPVACFDKLNKTVSALAQYGQFRVVRRACANFVDYGGTVEETNFFQDIFAKYDYRKVTIFINEFRGFFGLYRAQILTSCGVEFHKPNLTVVPSAKIVSDAQEYIADVLKGEPFVAVLARLERVILHLKHNLTECGLILKSVLRELSLKYSIEQYFLAMDVGKFGSSGATARNLTADRHGAVLLDAVYGGSVSFKEWESTFEAYISRVEGAYVANMQRTIGSRAKCLVMFGGGGFQGQARSLYERQHRNPGQRCIHKICHEQWGTAPIHVQQS